MEGDELNLVDAMTARRHAKHRRASSTEPARLFRRGQGAAGTVHVIEPREGAFRRKPQTEDHVHAKRFLRRIGVCTARHRWRIRVGVQPVGEAPSSAATVAAKQIVGPVLGQVVNGVGIATVDHGRFADDETLAREQVVAVAFPSKGVLHFGPVFTASVHVEPNKDLVGQGLQGPPHEVLQDRAW